MKKKTTVKEENPQVEIEVEDNTVRTELWHNIPECIIEAVTKLQKQIVDTNTKIKIQSQAISTAEFKATVGERKNLEKLHLAESEL